MSVFICSENEIQAFMLTNCMLFFTCLLEIFRTGSPLQCKSRWLRGLKHRSGAARLLRLWVRIPPRAWTFVCYECFVLPGIGLCDEVITRPEEYKRVWNLIVCDPEIS